MPDGAPTTAPEVTAFRMPSLGADMDAGTILEWLVHPGQVVHRGDIVAIVQTDKSDLDIEVFHDGVVAELVVPAGQKVPVGTVIAHLATTSTSAGHVDVPAVAPPQPSPASTPMPAREGRVDSPVLRHLAEGLHVDTAHLRGSGRGGRVTRDDIERAAARPRVTPRARRLARERGIDVADLGVTGVATGEHVLRASSATAPPRARRGPDPTAMREAIARQMTVSWQQIPHYRVATRVDVDEVMAALEERNLQHSAAERVLPAALLVHATARTVAAVPGVNGFWRDAGFEPGDGVHLGVVVALRTGGLLVPVLRDADTLDLAGTMASLRDLVTRARSGRLRASEVSGATFTITDLGEGGADTVHPIIHPPQVAILGFGSIHPEACVVEGRVVPRTVVHASLAGDHRAIDGRIGSLFLTTLTRILREDLTP